MAGTEPTAPEPQPDAGVEELRADIEQTREQLGETVGALADKLDVKARAEDKVAETVAHTKEAVTRRPVVPAAVLLGAVGVVGIIVWRRRH